MDMVTEIYCHTLDQLDRVRAIRAVHEAALHLRELYLPQDRGSIPVLANLYACLAEAGHPQFAHAEPPAVVETSRDPVHIAVLCDTLRDLLLWTATLNTKHEAGLP